ncbi:hypothetical protein [Natronobacterium gregoryi]|uniref:ParB-like nuclease n=2 Tax=Natronobacterium gregoryi TaxID=44930 RepID=L0AMJ7_NATGS|nr:hypothetical protein [Natronobacterium gregoryi]AFZ74422.1 hypothetical protein Natgr_3297 [Natronobacterium gregoryi SP2]ELY72118.1 hypothetical protein C490_04162 [Natronobacterium gregoryi SP2]PLK19751.1 hypothetical protein CYV19_13170 [Natronobacterium gregoryi SP2]SFJ40694.1 hypothetical protein SAMN05443661_12723 [Natronobacterium gregoryi]
MTDPELRIGSWKRISGQLDVQFRQTVTARLEATVPVELVRRGHRLRRSLLPSRYTDADPLCVVEVDPHRIERSILETAPTYPQWGRVEGGDWDRRWEPFDDRLVPQAMRQRFVDGQPWRETLLLEAYREQLERFGNAWEHTSIDGFDRRCRAIERLYTSIRTDGYKRQTELRQWSGREPIATRVDEINVDIARDGTLYWRGYGQHRLAIAKLLDLESVPVLLHRRHAGWQTRREQIREWLVDSGDAGDELAVDHPDLTDLVGANRGESS